jgi:hypothetical protein
MMELKFRYAGVLWLVCSYCTGQKRNHDLALAGKEVDFVNLPLVAGPDQL